MIGILSDSHDNLTRIQQAVRLFNDADCDLVIHAGDLVAPFAAQALRGLFCPVKAVFGNCDGEKPGLIEAFAGLGEIRDPPLAFSHGGLRFLVRHKEGPAAEDPAAPPCDVLVFGHTHRPLIQKMNGTLAVNPGESGGWLSGKSTVALLDPRTMTVDIISLG